MARIAIRLICALAAGSGGPAMAQDAQTGTATPAASPMAAAGEIVVTAQRRAERLTDVPISVVALSADKLATAGVTATGDLGRVTPGLTMDRAGPFSQPTIRGIGSSVTGPGIGTSVATYIDGFYQPSTVSNDFQLADVSSIQVLKGPQGTLFGRNSTGGAILVTTINPSFTPTLSTALSYGSFHNMRANAVASTGLTDTLAVYGAIFYHYEDGFARDVITHDHDQRAREFIARGKILYKPTDTLKFTLAYSHGDISNPYGVAQVAYHGISAAAGQPGAIIPDSPRDVASTEPLITTVRYDSIYFTGQLDLGGVTIKSYTGWRKERDNVQLDSDKSNYTYQTIGFRPGDRTLTQEFNLSSNAPGRLQWVAGLYYYHDRAAYNDLTVTQGTAPGFKFLDAALATDAYSAFGDVTWEPVDHLFVTGGLRYNREKSAVEYASILDGYAPHAAHKWFGNASPRGVIRYEFDRNTSVYASYNQGYKAGTFNSTGLSSLPVRPEKVNAYEVGFKANRYGTRLELAGFYYDYKDLQFVSFVGPTSQLTNAARARIYGIDAHLSQDIGPNLQIDLSGAYTHAQYRSFPGANRYYYDGNGIITNGPDDASGNRMIRTPRFSGRTAIDWHQTLAQGMARANVSYTYQTKVYFDPFETTEQKGYGLLDARISWTEPSNHATFSLYGRNLTNEYYYTVVTQQSESFPANYGEPRSFGGEIGLKF